MNNEKVLPKRKAKSYKVRSRTMEFIDTVLSPLRHNSVKELTNTFSNTKKGRALAIQSPSDTSIQNNLVIHEKKPKPLKKASTMIFTFNSNNKASEKSEREIFKLRSSLKKNKEKHKSSVVINDSSEEYSNKLLERKSEYYSNNNNFDYENNKKNNDKQNSIGKINIFKIFSNLSKTKEDSEIKRFRKTKSYSCNSNSLLLGDSIDKDKCNVSVCKNIYSEIDSTDEIINMNSNKILHKKDKIVYEPYQNNTFLPQIKIENNYSDEPESNVVHVKMRQPKRYNGSHTTSKFIDCSNEDVPDAPPRRKVIGFLHRTSNFSVDSTYSDDSANQYSSDNKNITSKEGNKVEKNNQLSRVLDLSPPTVSISSSVKQKFSHRERSLRYHRNMNVVLNMKVNEFLGINLIGHSSKNGDKGIFIADILPGGAISQCGRINLGDEILEVNGTSFENFTNDQAVNMLTDEIKKREVIRLKIRKHFNSITEYHNHDIHNGFGKKRFDMIRRSLREFNHSKINDEIWVRQKLNDNDETMTLDSQKILMPSIKESHENLASSSCVIKRSSSRVSEKKELTMHHVEKLFDLDSNKENVVLAMSLPNSYLEAKEKAWIKINYPMCFLGTHLIDWLLSNVKGLKDRKNARNYAFELLKQKLIVHVVCRYTFSEQSYYVFGEKIEQLKRADECGIDGLII
uniref:PDZ domain-containing protein n=1 Tax=Parastrongyloides trichosuri TaxID=131310 RepID=A0A0N4ZIS4_PARTI